jgi:ribosomal protein L18E
MKTKISKVIFANLSGIKDYRKLEKLVKSYEKLKAENAAKPNPHTAKRMEKLKAEIAFLMPDAEEGMKRIMEIYGSAINEMAEDNAVYGKRDTASFLEELKKMQENINLYKQVVG